MTVSNQQERNELKQVLGSGIFAKAPLQAKLLKYICEEYFQGRSDQIKEYTLATEVLGRAADFDQNRDAIVRVEVHRLRKKLKEYYEGEGSNHSFEILIDSGQYVPRFVSREKAYSLEVEASSATPHPHAKRNHESPQPSESETTGGTRRPPFGTLPMAVGGLVLVTAAVAVLLVLGGHWRTKTKASPATGSPTPAPSPKVAGPLDSVRILCGYSKDKYVDRAGNTWMGDRYNSGGETSAQPLQLLARAPDLALYQSFRFGEFSYDIPLRPGNYEMHLYFTETHFGPGSLSGGGETSRMFDIVLNGKPLVRLFDIIKDAGGNNIGDERVFKNVSPSADGYLHLKFVRSTEAALLDALAILPAPPGRINPIRIVAQNNPYTDREGNIWRPDCYSSGGQLALHVGRGPVSGTPDPSLYAGERFGNFSYAIPVAPGKYKVTLRFAETYWGLQNTYPNQPDQNGSPVGGVGSRAFDVYCNGVALLRNFDIYKDAGGALTPKDKTFHNVAPDAQGKLYISFVPVVDYACVNAIEVEDESP